jgi:asparagine synthase (glutamine-hydrolysing)
MVADVPLGAFLSGGVDSSLIVALMQAQSSRPVKTFTIGFHEAEYNEAVHARAVAEHLGTEHHELYVTAADALDVVPLLPAMFDEPFADSSQIPTYLVSKLTRQHVTVALSGDGGDEAFGGYDRYFRMPNLWRALAPVPRWLRRAAAHTAWSISPTAWDRILRFIPGDHARSLHGDRLHRVAGILGIDDRLDLYHAINSHWRDPGSIVIGGREHMTALTDPAQRPELGDYTAEMMFMDTIAYLPDDILVKVDRAAMAVSLEARAPLLHHEIQEFALRIPPSERTRGMRGKLPLRRVLDRYVPSALIERPKIGFSVPIDSWLRGPLRPWAEEMLSPTHLRSAGLFEVAPIRKLWDDHLSGSRNRQFLLWDVLMAMSWYDAQRLPINVPGTVPA